jgi:hypothetical protein
MTAAEHPLDEFDCGVALLRWLMGLIHRQARIGEAGPGRVQHQGSDYRVQQQAGVLAIPSVGTIRDVRCLVAIQPDRAQKAQFSRD